MNYKYKEFKFKKSFLNLKIFFVNTLKLNIYNIKLINLLIHFFIFLKIFLN